VTSPSRQREQAPRLGLHTGRHRPTGFLQSHSTGSAYPPTTLARLVQNESAGPTPRLITCASRGARGRPGFAGHRASELLLPCRLSVLGGAKHLHHRLLCHALALCAHLVRLVKALSSLVAEGLPLPMSSLTATTCPQYLVVPPPHRRSRRCRCPRRILCSWSSSNF
jgi:hypothetical protein